LATKQSKLKPMANINKSSQKTSNKDHLKVPIVTFFNRFQKVYLRFLSFGKDCKIGLNIRLPKGATIDKKTGMVEGHPEITKQILVYTERFENVFRQSILEGREPSPDFLKNEMFGINNQKNIPTLSNAMELYFEFQYGESAQMDGKTKEKNEYCKRYINEWILHELGKKAELADLKPIHAEKILNHIIFTKNVSKLHSRRSVGFLDRTLKFAVKSGWITANPFQYVLTEKVFQRQNKEITKFLNESELALIINAEIHNQELDTIRKWFVLGCLTGMDWFTFVNAEKSWYKLDADNQPYLDGIRSKGKTANPQPFIVPLNERASSLLQEFSAISPVGSELIFNEMPTNAHINRMLKEIAGLAGVKRPISFNWGRKSLATFLINKGIRAEIIKSMLGHAKLETTLTFYAKLDKKTVLREGRF
jgi:site-specific recombinase XerD